MSLTSSSSGDVISADYHKPSVKDYSWNPSNGVHFAFDQKQGKDLTWRPDYGIIFKDDTDIYSRNALRRKTPNSRQLLYNHSSDHERDPLQSNFCSHDLATIVNRKCKKLSCKTEANHQLLAAGPTNLCARTSKVPYPKKVVGGTKYEELTISKAPAREQPGIQKGDSQGPETDLKVENDIGDWKQRQGEAVRKYSVLPDLKNIDGIQDYYIKIRTVTRRISVTHYEYKLLAREIFSYQRLRIKILRVSNEDWEALLTRIDSNLSLFNDLQVKLLMAERFSGTVETLSCSKARAAVILNSSSLILLNLTNLCSRIKKLCWRVKYQRNAQKTLKNLLDMRSLLNRDFQDVKYWAHNTRQLFYARSTTFAQRIRLHYVSFIYNLKATLESLENMKSLGLHMLTENGKPSKEKINCEVVITNKEESRQKLGRIYLELKSNAKTIRKFNLKDWSDRLQQLDLLKNGSTKDIFQDWHVSPFLQTLKAFNIIIKMVFAINLSIIRKHNSYVRAKSRKEQRLKKSLWSLCMVVEKMGYINSEFIWPIFQTYQQALTRTIHGKTRAMLQSRLEALKMAKQKRLLISCRKTHVHHSTPSMHSLRCRTVINKDATRTSREALLAKNSPVVNNLMRVSAKTESDLAFSSQKKATKIRPVSTSIGNKYNVERGIKVPLKAKNTFYTQHSLGTKHNAETVIKVPPRMMLNISNLQMRGLHTSRIDQLSNSTTAGSKELHGYYNSNNRAANIRAAQLEYHIPISILQSGMRASPQTPAAYWSYDLYRNSSNDRVKLHYCVTKRSVELVCKYFLNQPVLGFDMEWDVQGRSGFKNKVSLIQLASEDRIALFHVSLFEDEDVHADSLPTLKAIMESKSVIKAGVSIKGDCTRLRKNIGIEACGLIELSHLHNLVKYSSTQPEKVSKRAVALAVQVEEHLQLPLHKGDVRESDWTQRLSAEQMIYAASDAYAGYRLFHGLEEKRLKLYPVPPRPAYADLGLPIKLAEKSHANNCETLNKGPGIGNERTLPTDELTNPVPIIISKSTETQGDPIPFTYSSAGLENRSSLSTSAQNARHVIPGRGTARFSDCPEIQEAEAWIEKWRAARSPSVALRISVANLRVYALWHAQSLELCRIASMLRDPPLQLSTVSCYLLECLKTEKLPFDESRIPDVIKLIPRFLVHGKYKHFLQRARLTGSDLR